MTREYYSLWYRLAQRDAYLIWYSTRTDEPGQDGVVLDGAGKILVFQTLAKLKEYAPSRQISLEDEDPACLHDLDVIQSWLFHPRKNTVDCKHFLTAWNFFGDVASTLQDAGFDANRVRSDKIYQKLFWGNNLPGMPLNWKHYEPVWTKSEVGRMQHVLGYGLQLFRRSLTFVSG